MIESCRALSAYLSVIDLAAYLQGFAEETPDAARDAADLLATGLLFHIGATRNEPLDIALPELAQAAQTALQILNGRKP